MKDFFGNAAANAAIWMVKIMLAPIAMLLIALPALAINQETGMKILEGYWGDWNQDA